jgi:hypothetical protein
MALSETNLKILRDKSFRQHLPTWANTFRRVDRLLQDIGPKCSRLEGIWQAIWAEIYHDKKLLAWFKRKYSDEEQTREVERPVQRARNPVDRAIKVLQSYGKPKR